MCAACKNKYTPVRKLCHDKIYCSVYTRNIISIICIVKILFTQLTPSGTVENKSVGYLQFNPRTTEGGSPEFVLLLCRDLNFCVTFFLPKLLTVTHCSKVNGINEYQHLLEADLTCDGLVSHPGGVKDSHPLNTTETRDVSAGSMSHLACKRFTA